MLTQPQQRANASLTPAAEAPRICTICDGLDAVLTLAAYVAAFPHEGKRSDLVFSQAIDALKAHAGPPFAQVLIAPNLQPGVNPQATLAIIDEALAKANAVTVVLPPGVTLPLGPTERLSVMQGPPFRKVELRAETAKPKSGSRGALQGLLGKVLGKGKSAEVEPPAPAPALPEVKEWRVIAVQPLCGGAGGTTLALNLATEIAEMAPKLSVCLIDLDLQFGNIGTYLNLSASTRILDAYRDVQSLDHEAFQLCLNPLDERVSVLTAPEEILPPDAIDGRDIAHLLDLAKAKADIIIVDLPAVISDMSGALMRQADAVICATKLDVRTAQNATKFRQLCVGVGLQPQKFNYVLNFAPAKRDRLWTKAQGEFEAGLGQKILAILPDCGPEITAASNAGQALRDFAPSNKLRSAIRKLCDGLLPNLGKMPKTETPDKRR